MSQNDSRRGFLRTLAAPALPLAAAQPVVYPVPEGEPASADYRVEIDGRRADVWNASVGEPWSTGNYGMGTSYGFVQFDSAGRAQVRIHAPGLDLAQVLVRPRSLGIRPMVVDRHTILLTVPTRTRLSVHPDGRKKPLLIFANPPEDKPPQRGDAGVLYFGPGVHRPESGVIELKSNQTLYLAGGAVLEAAVYAENAENIVIRGRGVLSGNRWKWRKGPAPGRLLSFSSCRNVKVEGIVLRGAWSWTLVPRNCENIDIANIKICNVRVQMNDDGINPCNSRHVRIRDCFVRTVDDCVAIKGLDYAAGDLDDIWIENSYLWCDSARVTLLGHESRAKFMQNIVYRNLDIFHHGEWPVFLLEPSDDMFLRNVRFEDLRIEVAPRTDHRGSLGEHLAVIRPYITQYSRTNTWGRIGDVIFRNIQVEGPGKHMVVVEGAPVHADRRIKRITFDNVRIRGEKLTADSMHAALGPWLRPPDEIVFR